MRRIVVIAEPGVLHGWGAASALAKAAGLEAISMGNLWRDEVQRGTAWGREISRYMDAGELVPDEVIGSLVADTLDNVSTGWVLFGHPRTVAQAALLDERGHGPDTAVSLVLDEERTGSDPRLVEHRMRVAPLWVYYRARAAVHTARGSGPFDEVAACLMTIVLPQ